jgi:butyryl-CoA dehydrogenase
VKGKQLAKKFLSKRNLEFLLYDVFDVTGLTQFEYYRDHDRETFDIILNTALDMAENLFYPALEDMDRNPPELADGSVKVHPAVRTILKELGEGGWIGSIFPSEIGGSQFPIMIDNICGFIFAAANYPASVYPALNKGAAGLIISFGSRELIETFVPRLLSGEWQGTMAMTEPQAGSSLADIKTEAVPEAEGSYKIRGRKIFISAGDHDAVDNIVHLMLARIKGAPVGVKGISLFAVPQKRINTDGNLVFNDIITSEIYHKLGYRGAPSTGLSIGEENDCRGFLIGEPHSGLRYMFQMMNETRLGVGSWAAAIASAAYFAALEYTRERPQGRILSKKDPAMPQVPIIEHPDIKRMLLFQRAVVEGSLSLIIQCSRYADLAKVLTGIEKEKNSLLLDILTPVAKSYPSEMGILSVSHSLQCLGGYGYCDDFPVEQYYRDIRIHPIHEGTTGIHGLDLLSRKVVMQDGRAFKLFISEVRDSIEHAEKFEELKSYANQLELALGNLEKDTNHLIGLSSSHGPERFIADASIYLEYFGVITIAWQWLLQGTAALHALHALHENASGADFYKAKIYTCRFFFEYELHRSLYLSTTLMNSSGLTNEDKELLFNE